MEIKLHFLPEKPTYSCDVLVFSKSSYMETIIYVSNVTYSAKYGLFNVHDWMHGDELDGADEYQKSLVAWAYMDEVSKEVFKCLTTK